MNEAQRTLLRLGAYLRELGFADEGRFRPDEIFLPEPIAHGAEDLEPRAVSVAWTRFRRTASGLKVGRTRCVEVPLAAPLAERALSDGATGRHPEAIDATGTAARELRAAGDVDFAATECEPLP